MTDNSPRPRRSEATREAILTAARQRFGADGYERATIRAIAGDVGIDPSMVMRYFGNKEGLFAASSVLDLRLPDPAGLPSDALGESLVTHFLNRWEHDGTLAAMLRVSVSNPAGAERLRSSLADQLGPFVAAVSPKPKLVARRAVLVASQMLGMAFCRYVVKMPPAVTMSRREIVAWLGPTVHRYLTEPQS